MREGFLLVWSAMLLVSAVAVIRAWNCTCPYRKRFFLPAKHKPVWAMSLYAVTFTFYVLIHTIGPLSIVHDDNWVYWVVDSVILVANLGYIVWFIGFAYYHEYPRVRRLKARVGP